MDKNPFIITRYAGEEYFCDREKETNTLIQLLKSGHNVALISPRRMGKTDLIRHIFNQKEVKEEYTTFLVDIYGTTNQCEMAACFAKAIVEESKNKGKRFFEEMLDIIKSIRPHVSFDYAGNLNWGVNFADKIKNKIDMDEIFAFLDSSKQRSIVAIDEFQQIRSFGNEADKTEAYLRTLIQKTSNANFIYSGSRRHMMGQMFTSAAKPFFQAATIFDLSPIPEDAYCNFAMEKFSLYGGRSLDEEAARKTYRIMEGITANMQILLNYLYIRTLPGKACHLEDVEKGLREYVMMAAYSYEELYNMLPPVQRKVFSAIATEGRATNVSGDDFLSRYGFTASSVASALRGLLSGDIVSREKDTYMISDLFFRFWYVFAKKDGMV